MLDKRIRAEIGLNSPLLRPELTLATLETVSVSDPRKANVSIMTRENRVSTNNLTQPDWREEPKEAAGLLARVLNKLDFHLKWYLCCGKTLESNLRSRV